jgi:hypothetical protein
MVLVVSGPLNKRRGETFGVNEKTARRDCARDGLERVYGRLRPVQSFFTKLTRKRVVLIRIPT